IVVVHEILLSLARDDSPGCTLKRPPRRRSLQVDRSRAGLQERLAAGGLVALAGADASLAADTADKPRPRSRRSRRGSRLWPARPAEIRPAERAEQANGPPPHDDPRDDTDREPRNDEDSKGVKQPHRLFRWCTLTALEGDSNISAASAPDVPARRLALGGRRLGDYTQPAGGFPHSRRASLPAWGGVSAERSPLLGSRHDAGKPQGCRLRPRTPGARRAPDRRRHRRQPLRRRGNPRDSR